MVQMSNDTSDRQVHGLAQLSMDQISQECRENFCGAVQGGRRGRTTTYGHAITPVWENVAALPRHASLEDPQDTCIELFESLWSGEACELGCCPRF